MAERERRRLCSRLSTLEDDEGDILDDAPVIFRKM